MDGITYSSAAGRWLLAVTVLGSGMAFLDSTVVNVALPHIGKSLHAPTSTLQWVLDGYLLTLASLILLGGSLGDRYGRRRIFVLGVALFTVSSLLCALSSNSGQLIAARLLQGVGGALLTPGSLALIESCFTVKDRSRAIGAWSGLSGVATALGPLLGGYLVSAVSWQSIFLINIPIGIVVVAMATRHVPETRDASATGSLDWAGAALAALGLGGTTYALIEAPGTGMSAAVVIAALAGLAALVVFLLWERRAREPMMPLSLFASRQFSAANGVTFVVYAALSGVFFLLVAFLQVAMGYSPVASGAATLPVTVLLLLFSARAGALAQRIGPRIPLTIGPVVVGLSLLLMTQLEPGQSYVTGVLPAILLFGLGLALVVAPVTATVLASADERHSGIASGVNNAVSRVAGLLAVAVLPLIGGITGEKFYVPSAMTHGFHVGMLASAVLAFAGGLLAWLTISSDALGARAVKASPHTTLEQLSCPVSGTPLSPPGEPAGASAPAPALASQKAGA